MSEERFFTRINKNGRLIIIDKECHIEIIDLTLACEVLNRLDLKLKTYNEQLGEQQATIKQLQDLCGKSDGENAKLRIENEQLRQSVEYWQKKYEEGTETLEIGEQQATIRKLQDLCGESDGENAKLRIENKRLQEENMQLKDYIGTIFEDNTHICKYLDVEDVQFYCDKNKNYRNPSCLYEKCFDEENLIKIKDEIRRVLE